MVWGGYQYVCIGTDGLCGLDGFFDTNSLLIHWELKKQINNLEKQKEFLHEEIAKDKKIIEKLSDPEELEKFAREQYYLKKKNEEIYLIEYADSVKTKEDE